MISEDKSDNHSGSESSTSEDLSHQSASAAAFQASQLLASRRSHVSSSNDNSAAVAMAASDVHGFGLNATSHMRPHHLAHYQQQNGFFATSPGLSNGGHMGAGVHMVGGGYGNHHIDGGHSSGGSGGGGGGGEASRKRAVRLQKNREAARECRRKKKEYIKCLENRVAVLENQNKALIEELKSLKELYAGKSHGPKIEIL